jgi:hypothetical protein
LEALFRGRLDQKQFEFSELAVAAYFDPSEGGRRGALLKKM